MKMGFAAILLVLCLAVMACHKNNVSKIPSITLMSAGPDSIRIGDSAYIEFHLIDGDGDLGTDSGKDVFVKDSRFDTAGFIAYPFPNIDRSIENPAYGIEGTCLFILTPDIFSVRSDTLHTIQGDTASFELYIVDRAGHQSNHIFTPSIIIRP